MSEQPLSFKKQLITERATCSVRVNKMKNRFIGIDIGGTKCAVLLAEVDNGIRILKKLRFPTEVDKSFAHTYQNICDAITRLIKESGDEPITAIGISCGGPLDSKSGIILGPPNLPGWEHVPIKEMLEKRFQTPVYLQNDANACALVEWKMGAGRGTDNMVFLTMGTGMGAGIIAEGRLLRGFSDMGGEAGHIRLTENGPEGYGKAGSFEGYVSGGGIKRQAETYSKQLIAEGHTPAWITDGRTPDDVDAACMAEYARSGNAQALEFFRNVGKMLGRGIAYLVDLLNPERVVIGSIFVRCEDLLREPMEEELKKEALSVSLKGVSVVPAATGEQIGDYASIMTALYKMNIDPLSDAIHTTRKEMVHFQRLFERYPVLEACRDQIMNAYLLLRNTYDRKGKLMIIGNGGSCSDCEHIVGELMKGFNLKRPLGEEQKRAIKEKTDFLFPEAGELLQQGLPAIDLNAHSALNSAVANDQDPLLCASQQILVYGVPGDTVLGISTSGNSRNVLMAMATAKGLKLHTIGLTGRTGGEMKKLCDCTITVPADKTSDIQELHLPVYHTLCAMLEEYYFG